MVMLLTEKKKMLEKKLELKGGKKKKSFSTDGLVCDGKEVRCNIVFHFISKRKMPSHWQERIWCSDSAKEVRAKLYL